MTNEIKKAWNEYKISEMLYDAAEQAYINDPENLVAEGSYEAAYEINHKAFVNMSELIEKFTAGQVSAKTARTMILQNFAKVDALVASLA